MTNFKKVGLTALAASLVSVSAHAGSLTASGSASMNTEGHSGENLNAGTTFSMANHVVMSGSGELDNGMTVSLSFELDNGDANNGGPFDSHSVSVSSDAMGTLTLAGHGGSSASSKIDTTAAGDLWDNFDQLANGGSITFPDAIKTNAPGNNAFFYASPDLMDGLNFTASYTPSAANGGVGGEMGYGINFSGYEGLSVSYATTDVEAATEAKSGDNTVMKASYAFGPVTLAYSVSEQDTDTTSLSGESTSYSVAYSITDEFSIEYGSETHEQDDSSTDAEIDGISASFTTGGITLSASMVDGENLAFGTASAQDVEYWSLGASFAF
jgi:outer membrane protein OmpU